MSLNTGLYDEGGPILLYRLGKRDCLDGCPLPASGKNFKRELIDMVKRSHITPKADRYSPKEEIAQCPSS